MKRILFILCLVPRLLFADGVEIDAGLEYGAPRAELEEAIFLDDLVTEEEGFFPGARFQWNTAWKNEPDLHPRGTARYLRAIGPGELYGDLGFAFYRSEFSFDTIGKRRILGRDAEFFGAGEVSAYRRENLQPGLGYRWRPLSAKPDLYLEAKAGPAFYSAGLRRDGVSFDAASSSGVNRSLLVNVLRDYSKTTQYGAGSFLSLGLHYPINPTWMVFGEIGQERLSGIMQQDFTEQNWATESQSLLLSIENRRFASTMTRTTMTYALGLEYRIMPRMNFSAGIRGQDVSVSFPGYINQYTINGRVNIHTGRITSNSSANRAVERTELFSDSVLYARTTKLKETYFFINLRNQVELDSKD